ncbi:MAG: 4-(cytidine 5'-diphospho)-2-C-methyl-D-erythritol kinase [Chitinophagaceae bacterium]|nr:4-(cytidine 5'-diphospho)-2-C-methyl-D-erythritol kinase [Chitinophagaceae bacterium]
MVCFPNCKINLGLYITNRRPDGYHDLETVFYPIKGLNDALEVVPATGPMPKLVLNGKSIAGNPEQNLIWKAYELLQQRFPAKVPALDIYLLKAIPMGAGLGGGSADGAFMLRLLNDYCRLELSDKYLAEMALELGSDCPFFIYNTPHFAKGRGEQMSPIPMLDLSAYSIQLICPEVHISTKDAFSMITPRKPMFDLRKLPELPISQWKDNVSNDFEDAVFMQHPELGKIKRELYEQGAVFASMSGSGSTLYGIFEKGAKAEIVSGLQFTIHYFE